MNVVLLNPPYVTLTSSLGVGHQVPLGLLAVGGSLIDAGHAVSLLDAEALRLSDDGIVDALRKIEADVVMTGHAGSTPAHPICIRVMRAIKRRLPQVITIYGGVYPTYHARQILRDEPSVDVIVRGEGEATATNVVQMIDQFGCVPWVLSNITGIAFRGEGSIILTPDAAPIRNLDAHRVGWELIDDWDRYQCFFLGRSSIVQFSRGCPHRCTYCGQHGFWVKWRHRDPARLADEIAWLHDVHGVKFITLADENPTTNQRLWRQFLEEIIKRGRDVQFFATIRAADIVRDAEFIDLYRRAGILYILMGIDATDPRLIDEIKKRSSRTVDAHACALLSQAGIRSMIAHIVGLGEDTWQSFWRAFQTMCRYDGDLLNVMYATPHSWTAFARQNAARLVVQENQRLWDYRHQILHERGMTPLQLFTAVKLLELVYHLRPKAIWRLLFGGDWRMRRQRWWTQMHITAVWFGEIAEFLFSTRTASTPEPLAKLIHIDDCDRNNTPAPNRSKTTALTTSAIGSIAG